MPRLERERRYISEFMLQEFPGGDYQLNVPLGPIDPALIAQHGMERALALSFPIRPRVDAVAWRRDTYIIVEAKIRSARDGLGDLRVYRDLIPSTPDLPYYSGQRIEAWLVVPVALDWIKAACQAAGIVLQERLYPWISDYVRERQEYFTGPYRRAREEKAEMRRLLGLD